jgi:hypothetical protein
MGVFHTCKFSQRINREQKHEAGDKKVNDQRSRTSRGQRASRTNEQAGSYAPPNCNHLHMSAFELLLQFTVVAMFYVDRGRHPWLTSSFSFSLKPILLLCLFSLSLEDVVYKPIYLQITTA